MKLRQTCATIFTLIALASTAPQAAEFSALPLQLPMNGPALLHSPLRAGNGDIVLVESSEDGDDTRRMRFSEDGAWLGSVPYGGRSRLLPTGHGGFLAIQSNRFRSYCDLQGLGANVAMTWRHASLLRFDDELEAGDCGHFASDASSRLWFADADWRIGHLRADGSFGSELDIRQFLAPNQSVQTTALTTLHTNSAAVYAFSDVFDASRSELVAFNPGMLVRWRRPLATSVTETIDVQALHAGDDDQLRVVAAARRDGNDPTHLQLTAIDANGQLLWSRHHDALPVWSIEHSHRFNDGSIGVLYLAPTADPNVTEFRVVVLAPNGDVQRSFGAGTTPLWTVRFTQFIELGNGTRWLFSNRPDAPTMTGMAWALDAGGALQTLPIGQQIGVLPRGRGDALVFGSTLGTQAMRFDGGANSGRIAFAAPQPLGNTPYPIAVSRLQDDGRLLLSEIDEQLWLARFDVHGDLLWRSPTQGRFGFGLQDRPASPLLITAAQQACVVTDGVSEDGSQQARQLECFALANGARAFTHLLQIPPTSRLFVATGSDGIDLLFKDDTMNLHHRWLRADGTLGLDRMLGAYEPVWLEPGLALGRRPSESAQWVESSRAAAEPTTRDLAPESPLLTDDLLARIDGDEFLFSRPVQVDLQTKTRFRVGSGDTPDAVRWSHDVAGYVWNVPAQGGGVGIGPTSIFVIVSREDTGEESLHRIRLADGAEPEPAIALGSMTDRAAADLYGDGGLVVASSSDGQIAWRRFAADGSALNVSSWRCPGDCVRVVAAAGGREVLAWTASAFDDTTLHALSAMTEARKVPRSDDGAIAGVFIATNDTNRGYLIDWLPSARMLFVARFAGDGSQSTTRERLDWETFQGVVAADASEITLTRYRNADGRFGATDDAPVSTSGSASFRFDGCDAAELVLTDTRGPLTYVETVHLRRSGPRLKPCRLIDGSTIAAQAELPARGGFDARQSGAWIAAGASHQGLFVAVLPATEGNTGVFFAPWFTYWTETGANPDTENRHWLTLQGTLTPASSGSVALTIYRATAGSHGPVRPSNNYRVGEAIWTVVNCEQATLDYRFDGGEHAAPYSGRQGRLNFSRPGACNGGP